MDNAFIRHIRSKRARCIFFGIIRTQDMDFLSQLSFNHIMDIWKINNNYEEFSLIIAMLYEKNNPQRSQNSVIYGFYINWTPYIRMNLLERTRNATNSS
jgi:hypothetical protein